ncbi:hypothetical protein ACKVWL_010150, partial [Pyricularia oryzae]
RTDIDLSPSGLTWNRDFPLIHQSSFLRRLNNLERTTTPTEQSLIVKFAISPPIYLDFHELIRYDHPLIQASDTPRQPTDSQLLRASATFIRASVFTLSTILPTPEPAV